MARSQGREAFDLGPNGHKLLNQDVSKGDQPTEVRRRLEVTLLWGDTVIDVRTFGPEQTVRVGPGGAVDLRVYAASLADGFELVSAGVIRIPESASVTVHAGGRSAKRTEPRELALHERALVTFDTTHLILRWIRPAARLTTALCDSLDVYFTKMLAATLVASIGLLAAFWITPTGKDLLAEELFKDPGRWIKAVPPKPPPDGVLVMRKPAAPAGGTHEPHRAPPRPNRLFSAPSASVDARRHERDRARVLKAGLFAGLQEGAARDVFSGGGLSASINDALGALHAGAGAENGGGLAGFGSRGSGPGSGGTALGIGDRPLGGAGGPRTGNLQLGSRQKGTPHISTEKINVGGGALSREVIERIVRQHQNEIRYCYDVELNRHHDLYGKVAMAFTIDGTGTVSEANVSESTMNNADVESCLATKIRRWRFPEPKGGGQVFVTYPWIFKAPGTEE